MHFTYWIILLASLSFPLLKSFGPPVHFFYKWRALFPAILITALPFLIWDALFTEWEIWGFNEKYTTGLRLAGLPLEEICFFLIIPYCCMFIYEVVRLKIKPVFRKTSLVNLIVSSLLIVLSIIFSDRAYTLWASVYTLAVFILIWMFQKHILPLFYTSFLFMLFPFLLVNGVLTGSFIHEEVVWYNDAENLGIRLFTIPMDDFIYCLGLMLTVVGVYEFLLKQSAEE